MKLKESERLSYTTLEVAEITGQTYQAVMRAIHAGDLKARRPKGSRAHIILRSAVVDWLESMPDA